MITVYYKNHLGEIIDLRKAPYRIITGDLLNYEWEDVSGVFERGLKEKNVKMDIFTKKSDYHRAINHLHEVFEKDVLNNSPGKLYFCESYIPCYIVASSKSSWEADIYMTVDLKIRTESSWISESVYTFHSYNISSTDNKVYPYKYPYRYANGMSSSYVINPHFADSNFTMIIYGPVVNPQVTIGGVTRLVNVVLEAGEYLEINSRSGTVIKVMTNGGRVNAFHNRAKGRTFFQKIPPGRQSIIWPGTFDFDLIIYEERGEPKWNE